MKKIIKSAIIYWEMFFTFLRIGAFTIGGGYAMIPLIRREVVEKKKWIDDKEFIDMLAMAQSAPGVIAVNISIFVGYKIKGLKGSLVTTLGSSLTSFLIILLVAMFFIGIKDNQALENVFKGLRPAVVALIIAPIYNLCKSAEIGWKTFSIPILTAVLIRFFGISPMLIIFAGVIFGIVYGIFHSKRITKKNENKPS